MYTPQLNCRLGLFYVLSTVVAVCFLTATGLAQSNGFPPPSVRWETDIDVAMSRAEREQRPIFIHFIGNNCQPAQQMAVEVFTQPNIIARLNTTFVMVRINASENETLAQKFNVKSVPTDLVLKHNGQLVHRRTGGITADRFSDYLTFLQNMLQSERGPLPNPPAANPFSVANPAGSSNPPPIPPQREVPPSPGTIRDPFAQQLPLAQQPTNMPSNIPSVQNNPLRSGETPGRSTAEYVAHPPQMPAPQMPAMVPAPLEVAAMPTISAVMANEPAPSKMTVEVPLALEGFCPLTLCLEEKWIPGNPAYCTMYQGHIFRFASAETMMTFVRNPANYIPVAMGEDIVFMVDRNKRINGNRRFGAWYQGRVFLFSSQEALNAFSERPDYYTEIALKYEMARKEQVSPIVY
jgi:YHS domain-containing protein/thioredoxin-related protein